MGKFVGSALIGAIGSALFFGCGAGATGPIEAAETFEADGATSGIDPTGRAKSASAGEDAGGADDSGPWIVDAAIGEDAATVVDAAGNVDSGGPPTPTTFAMPAILKDDATCWQDSFPNPVCESVPAVTPPIYELKCEGVGISTAKLRVPPKSCIRVSGRFDASKVQNDGCFTRTSCTPQPSICRSRDNPTDADQFVYVHDTGCGAVRFTAWWYPLDECPGCP